MTDAPRVVHVVVEHPFGSPRLVAFDGPSLLVGRGSDCAISLDDDQVSREHALLLLQGDGVVVRDLGSRNGTFVNGSVVVGDVTVSDDDLITIGRARLAVRRTWSPTRPVDGSAGGPSD